VTALLEYLDEVWKISQEALKTITSVSMQNAVIMCTVFILLQYFGSRIAHLTNILENHPIMLP